MQPPLPEVPKKAPVSNAKPAFFGLSVAVGVNLALTLSAFALNLVFTKGGPVLFYSWPFMIIQVVLWSLYSLQHFYLWRGYNWARWVTIAVSVFSLVLFFTGASNGESPSKFPAMSYFVEVARWFWGLGLGIWLSIPNIARHFKAPKPI